MIGIVFSAQVYNASFERFIASAGRWVTRVHIPGADLTLTLDGETVHAISGYQYSGPSEDVRVIADNVTIPPDLVSTARAFMASRDTLKGQLGEIIKSVTPA